MDLLFYDNFYTSSKNDEIRWSEMPKSLKTANRSLQLNVYCTLTSFFSSPFYGVHVATSRMTRFLNVSHWISDIPQFHMFLLSYGVWFLSIPCAYLQKW